MCDLKHSEVVLLLFVRLVVLECCGIGARLWANGFGGYEEFQGRGSYIRSTRVFIALELHAEQDISGILLLGHRGSSVNVFQCANVYLFATCLQHMPEIR